MNVLDIGNALPSASRRPRNLKPSLPDQPMPKSLPECFAEVWRRRKSALPVHRRERAALEAVALTIPSHAASLTGSAAAAVYLGALVVSLERLVQTTQPSHPVEHTDKHPAHTSLKKNRKQRRREQEKAEHNVKNMTTNDVLRPMMKSPNDDQMNVDEQRAEDNTTDPDLNSDAELVASILYLISSAIGGSSTAVMQAKGAQILDVVVRAMNHVSGYGLAARHASTCICQMLSVLDASSWSKPVIQRSYLYLIRLTMDGDAKSRKKAREALHQLLSGPRFPLIRSKTSGTAAAQYISQLNAHSLSLDAIDDAPRNQLPAALVHTITSIEQFAVFLKPNDAAKVAKELVLVATRHSQNVSSFALLALWSLLKHRSEERESESASNQSTSFLASKDIAKLLTAILRYEVQEDSSDNWRIAYCSCIADGAMAYADFFTHTPPPIDFVAKPVTKICDALRLGNLENFTVKRVSASLQSLLGNRWFRKRPILLKKLEEFLDDRYRHLQNRTTTVLKRYLEQEWTARDTQMEDAVSSIVKTVLAKRESAKSDNDRKIQSVMDSLLSSVVRGGGAGRILSVVSVKFDADKHLSNPWFMPILLNNLRGTPLALFFEQFRPLAEKLTQAKEACAKQKRVIEAKNISMYLAQVWNLLPGFCTSPPDLTQEGLLSETFKSIHFCMTTAGNNDMINIGADALRHLARSVQEVVKSDVAVSHVSSSFASRFKKLFPTILQVAESVHDEKRLSLLSAITASCQACGNPTFVSTLLKKTIRRMLELRLSSENGAEYEGSMTDRDSNARSRALHASADLAIAIIESKALPQQAEELTFLEKAVSPFLTDPKESALQKKAYRSAALLISIRENTTDVSEMSDFGKRVAKLSSSVAPGAKASRQGLIIALIEKQNTMESTEDKINYLQSINDGFLSEILLGTRDSSEKTRAASFLSLVALARGWNTCLPGNSMEGLQRFFLAVAAGLAGKTVAMLAATLTSLGRLLYDFRGEIAMSDDLSSCIDSLFASVTNSQGDEAMTSELHGGLEDEASGQEVEPGPIAILLRHNAVEVQKAALGVIKVATKALTQPLPKERLNSILPGILPGLVHAAAKSKKQETRLRVRVILERLLRKCGRAALELHFPQEHAKLLSAVRKKYSRELVRKHAGKEDRARRMEDKRNRAGLVEKEISDGDDSGLDSSDSDIERDILDGDTLLTRVPLESGPGTKQNGEALKSKGGKLNSSGRDKLGIRYAEDGRPIFVESDAESGDAEAGSLMDGDDDDLSDDEGRQNQTRKRKRTHPQGNDNDGKRMKGAFGEEYRGKRGKGDIKRPGRPDPYAYVPLGQNMLGKGTRIGRSTSRRSKQESSLHRLAGQIGTKKKVRKLGIPGRR